MARIIYKEGYEGQNNLSSIEGIEINLLNGQKALIYPKYAEKSMLSLEQARKWDAPEVTEIEALKVIRTISTTGCLRDIGSPSSQWALQFKCGRYKIFCLPSLLAAMEIQHQKEEIDTLAETIEGADLLRDFTSFIWSCSRYSEDYCWCADGCFCCADGIRLTCTCLVVPTILY